MLVEQLAQKYAQAVYELAAENNLLEQVETELQMVGETIEDNPDLAIFLYHPQVLAAAKKETVSRIFKQELSEMVHTFLLLLIDKRREAILPAIVREYCNLSNAARNIAEAEVTTAKPLSDAEHAALADKLSAVTGKNMVLKTSIDPRLLGGVIVKMGDKLIDGSVVRQLEMLKTTLLGK
ncbi:MAG: F0F1 ATP synthase subunit delta [Veillonellales bacterium]